eukprot:9177501-Pyramimonas_sp.AAC.1
MATGSRSRCWEGQFAKLDTRGQRIHVRRALALGEWKHVLCREGHLAETRYTGTNMMALCSVMAGS